MKKHLLTAALAIVAVGGVFASNANPSKPAPWTTALACAKKVLRFMKKEKYSC